MILDSSDSDSDSDSPDLVDDTEPKDNTSDKEFKQSNTKKCEDAGSPLAVSTNTHENSITHPTPAVKAHSRPFIHAPTQATAAHALCELDRIIRPPRKKGDGYRDPRLPLVSGGPFLIPHLSLAHGAARLAIANGSADPAHPVVDFPAKPGRLGVTRLAPLAAPEVESAFSDRTDARRVHAGLRLGHREWLVLEWKPAHNEVR